MSKATTTESEKIYRLVTIGEEKQLTLATAEATERKAALIELKLWAEAHGWELQKRPNGPGNCIVQELERVDSDEAPQETAREQLGQQRMEKSLLELETLIATIREGMASKQLREKDLDALIAEAQILKAYAQITNYTK